MATQTQRSAPDQHPLTADLLWLLTSATYALKAQVTQAMVDVGISPRQHHVLVAAGSGEHTQSALAATVGLDKTTLLTTLDDLEAQGLVERRPLPHDRRARVVAVTDAGRAKLEHGTAFMAELQADILKTLPPTERTVFLESLAELVDAGSTTRAPAPISAAGHAVADRSFR